MTRAGGVQADRAKAAEWYEKAAQQGYARAQYNLGNLYYEGIGAKKDYEKALYWYQKAADQKEPRAQERHGILYEFGHGVPMDKAKARAWYQLAAARRDLPMPSTTLGFCWNKAWVDPRDLEQAAKWYEKAAAQGSYKAREALPRVQAQLAADSEREGRRLHSGKHLPPREKVRSHPGAHRI